MKGRPFRFVHGHQANYTAGTKMAIKETDYWIEDGGHDTPCWIHKNTPRADGYVNVNVWKKTWFAHRAMWEQEVGPIPDGMQVDHLCHRRACINPAHLEVVTPQVNSMRSLRWPREGLTPAA